MELAEKCRVAVAVSGVFLGLQRLVAVGGYALLWGDGGSLIPPSPSAGPAWIGDLLPLLGIGVSAALVMSSVAALMRVSWARPAMLMAAIGCIAFVLMTAGNLFWWIYPQLGLSGWGLWIGITGIIEQVFFELAYYSLVIILFWQGGGTHASAGGGAFRPRLLTRDDQ